eukprot:2308014-Pleurochrysis_carterae.AAC.1
MRVCICVCISAGRGAWGVGVTCASKRVRVRPPAFAPFLPPLPQIDWFSASLLLVLWLLHGLVGYYEYLQSVWAAETLEISLSSTAMVKRDGKWITIDSKLIVPADLLKLSLGDRVPADCRIVAP